MPDKAKRKKYRLVAVDGDQIEFSDLLGAVGPIRKTSDGLTFFPDNRGDWLVMQPRRDQTKDRKRRVTTGLKNTFVFEEIAT